MNTEIREWVISFVCALLIVCVATLLVFQLSKPGLEMKKQIVSLQMDRDELKLHTEQLRVIVTEQQNLIKKMMSTAAYVDSVTEEVQ